MYTYNVYLFVLLSMLFIYNNGMKIRCALWGDDDDNLKECINKNILEQPNILS